MKQISEQTELANAPFPADEYHEETFRYGFRIADLGFLIPQGAHSTFIDNADVFPVPNTNNWLRGLVNIRGSMIPVFDLGRMLETDIKAKKKSVMAMTLNKRSFGFLVDSGQSLKESTLLLFSAPIPEQFKEYAQRVYQDQQTNWIEFDFLKCLSHYENRMSV